jgi:hydroxymethylglutaryl-CoA reductase (NADPH)
MFVLAPTFTLETIAKILLVSFGSFTGIPKVEVYAWFAVVLTFVNFIVYMTIYPAALSLILELMYSADGRARWDVRQIIQSLPSEDGYSPAVHKVNIFWGNSIHLFSLHKRNTKI